jgi:Undecaprenyl-phosphate glucose phosphotransferase
MNLATTTVDGLSQLLVADVQARREARQLVRSWSPRIVRHLSVAMVTLFATVGGLAAFGFAAYVDIGSIEQAAILARLMPAASLFMLLILLLDRASGKLPGAKSPRSSPVHVTGAYLLSLVACGAGSLLVTNPALIALWVAGGCLGETFATRAIGQLGRTKFIEERLSRGIAIYGSTPEAKSLFELLRSTNSYRLVGLFDDRCKSGRVENLGVSIAGGVDELVEIARTRQVDEIMIMLPVTASRRIADVVDRLKPFPIDVKVFSSLAEVAEEPAASAVGRTVLINAHRRSIADWSMMLKTIGDRFIALVALVMLVPVFMLVALAIKIDSRGPVFFRQMRHGIRGESIEVWKFRTMNVMENGPEIRQASKHDPRITRVGRILRKTSLDELPQLINVLLGNMSLVGPRPHAIAHNEHYARIINEYEFRNQVRPGITGWAQINGLRGDTTDVRQMAARVEHDIWYLANWSLWLDIKILLLTPVFGFVHKNAF